MICQVINISDR